LWAEGLSAKDIDKEMFLVYGGKCLSRKVVHIWVPDFLLMTKRLKRKCRCVLRQQPKDFYAAGFNTLVKLWDKCISVGGEYVEK
jgi:hypothetical protein